MGQLKLHETSGAVLEAGEDGRNYRYSLLRQWDRSKPLVMFVGLNPSTATESSDDPTIRRVRNFAKVFGFGGFYMVNCFPMITPKPEELVPCNIEKNDEELNRVSQQCSEVVFCWGSFSVVSKLRRDKDLFEMFPNAKCFGKNANGSPKHPLYLRADTKLVPFR